MKRIIGIFLVVILLVTGFGGIVNAKASEFAIASGAIEAVLKFIDQAVDNGELAGYGNGAPPDRRLNTFVTMINRAYGFLGNEKFDAAHRTLGAVYKRCDGDPAPPDYVTGSAVENIANMILAVHLGLGGDTSGWTAYSPSWPPSLNTLDILYVDRVYLLAVTDGCDIQYGSNSYSLSSGWNMIVWLPNDSLPDQPNAEVGFDSIDAFLLWAYNWNP
jgi:hypothetical protein